MVINYLEAQSLPKKKSGDLHYGKVVCKDLKESRKLFRLLDRILNWDVVEGISMNGKVITVTFWLQEKKKKNVNRKKKMPKL